MTEQVNWYVIHTYSGYENKVANNLATTVENRRMHDFIQEIKIPVEIIPEIKDGVKKEVEHKLFPGYVLVKMILTDESWYIVRNTRGVTGFVGTSTKPVPLSQAEVDNLGVETPNIKLDYEIGDHVEVTDGSLEGCIGAVEAIDTKTQKVTVKVSMFGRETSAELDLTQVKPL